MLTIAGTYHNDMAPETHWSFEGHGGELVIQEHVADDYDERAMTADELKALIEKRAAKIEKLEDELTHLKDYLVRHHRDQIGDALTEAEAMEISERIDAEATARPANTTEAIARLTRMIEERRAKEETAV
jgi:Skp family chaperone for outer membrane proteins